MNTRSRAISLLLAALAMLLVPASVFAKEEGLAAMDTPISGDAEPGSTLDVGWSTFMELEGIRQPFSGASVFIRLTSPDSANVNEVIGTESPLGSGHFSASIVVPEGGIGEVTVGMIGESCMDGVCERSEMIFPFVDEPLARSTGPVAPGPIAPAASAPVPVNAAPAVASTASGAPSSASPVAMALIVIALAVLLVVAMLGLGLAARRGRTPGLPSTQG